MCHPRSVGYRVTSWPPFWLSLLPVIQPFGTFFFLVKVSNEKPSPGQDSADTHCEKKEWIMPLEQYVKVAIWSCVYSHPSSWQRSHNLQVCVWMWVDPRECMYVVCVCVFMHLQVIFAHAFVLV